MDIYEENNHAKKHMNDEKTHWLKTPNKNFLGHYDLPNGEDQILTIDEAKWETVKNPLTNTSEPKRVIRFKESSKWIKPFICNETNSSMICKVTGKKFMEDCKGMKVMLGVSTIKVKKEVVECLRVRNKNSSELTEKCISIDQANIIKNLIIGSDKSEIDILTAMGVNDFLDIKISKFNPLVSRLKELQTKIENGGENGGD